MLSQVSSFNAQSYSNLISGGMSGGKLYVPVKPSQVIFSQFEHVSGVASKHIDSGVPVQKINILNALIDQLVKIKSDSQKPVLAAELSDSQIDALIEDYQNKISNAVNIAKQTPFGPTITSAQMGMVLDTFA